MRAQGQLKRVKNTYFAVQALTAALRLREKVPENTNQAVAKKNVDELINEFREACERLDSFEKISVGQKAIEKFETISHVLTSGFNLDFQDGIRERFDFQDIIADLSREASGFYFEISTGVNYSDEIDALSLQLCKPDLYEAVNCLRAQLATATVFHLARSLEALTKTLCRHLRIGGVRQNATWHELSARIDGHIKSMPEKSLKQREKRRMVSAISASLSAIRVAWRNDVMHPGPLSNLDEAEKIFRYTLDIMRGYEALKSPGSARRS